MGNNSFFQVGARYRCKKAVKGYFAQGSVYGQSASPTEHFGWLVNDEGIPHVWPQPASISETAGIWDIEPEDIDPRIYFEQVIE